MTAPGTRTALAAGIAVLLLTAGCTGGQGEPDGGGPTAPADTAIAKFEKFSGVAIPDDAKRTKVGTDRNESGATVHTVRFTGTPESAEVVCTRVGNWLPRSQGVPEVDQKRFGIGADEVGAAEGEVRGCGAVVEDTGVQIDGIVLYPDDTTADVYLVATEIDR